MGHLIAELTEFKIIPHGRPLVVADVANRRAIGFVQSKYGLNNRVKISSYE